MTFSGLNTQIYKFRPSLLCFILTIFLKLLNPQIRYISGNYFYLRAMIKKLLFIVPLLFLLLLNLDMSIDKDQTFSTASKESVMKESGIANLTHDVIQGDELTPYHNLAFCTPSRSIQFSSENSERLFKVTSRQFEQFLQKGQNQLNKTSEIVSAAYSLNYSSLRIRSGHWVYVLRKIII